MKKLLLFMLTMLLINISWAQEVPPEMFKFQAYIYKPNGNPVSDKTVGVEISIYQTAINGTLVYTEEFTTTTNKTGIINLEIGNGASTFGTFSLIPWEAGEFFIQLSADINGGTNYTIMGASQLLSVPYALLAKNALSALDDFDTDPKNEIELPESAIENDVLTFNGSEWVALANEDGDPTNEIELPEVDGTEGQVLTTNVDGIVSWNTPAERSLSSILGEDNDGGDNQIKNIAAPSEPQDVATKLYVDFRKWDTDIQMAALKYIVDELFIDIVETEKLLAVGYTVQELLDGGHSVAELVTAGASISDLLSSGISLSELLSVGVSVLELLSGGALVSELYGISYEGGLIFYVNETNGTGLVTTPSEVWNDIKWHNSTYINTGATDTAIGTGELNTSKIIQAQGYSTPPNYAALLTSVYQGGGYTDWFLPSEDELKAIHTNLCLISGYDGYYKPNNNGYWSSTEVAINVARAVSFPSSFGLGGTVVNYSKDVPLYVLAVRAF